MTGKSAKRGFIALALVALSLLLARPVCDAIGGIESPVGPLQVATAAQPGDLHDDSGPCCISVDNGALGAAAGGVSLAGKTPASASGSPFQLVAAFSPGLRSATIPPGRPPIFAAYYARTARILI
jgi:hypothetical protein